MYKGCMSGWVVGRMGSWRQAIPSTGKHVQLQTAVLCLHQVTEMNAIHSTGRDGHWQQFGTTYILVNATHWLHRPCSAPL